MTEANTLDALIVKHIADLEAARRHIKEKVDPRLLREASATMERRADELGWVHEFEEGGKISVAPEEWIERNENGEIDTWFVWFELSKVDANGELEHFWHLAEFLELEGGSTRKALSFYQDVLNNREWRGLLNRSTVEVKALRGLGFDVDEREGSIELPVRLDAAALQLGFEEDDLDKAMAPVGEALDLAIKAMPHLQILVSAVLDSRKD